MREYTDEQLAAMDRAVAEHIMGWQVQRVSRSWALIGTEHGIDREDWLLDNRSPVMELSEWCPTYNRGQAMLVFEQCSWMVLMHEHLFADGLAKYRAGEMEHFWEDGLKPETEATAPTPMLAICLAALKRAGVKV